MFSQPTIHVFIDTNVFLSFCDFKSEEVEELKKLVGLINQKRLALYLTEQVRNEFYRNRDSKLGTAIETFRSNRGSANVPRFMNDFPEVAQFRTEAAAVEKTRTALISRARADALGRKLAVDELFSAILQVAQIIKTTPVAYATAHQRTSLGDPPGKNNSIGDRLNWLLLLETVPTLADLHVVSADSDFASALDRTLPNGFLTAEWNETHGATLYIYQNMNQFLSKHFPAIKLAIDIEKLAAIEGLVWSGTFQETHAAVAKLKPFANSLTDSEAVQAILAGVGNSQISWIATDPDIQDLYGQIVGPKFARLPPAVKKQ